MSSFGRARLIVLSSLVAAAASSAALVLAQSPGPQAATQVAPAAARPTPASVDFIAADGNGGPVLDLQPSEIEVKVNGRTRIVRSLVRTVSAPAAASAAGVPSPYGTNSGVAAGRSFAIVIDQESLVPGREQTIRDAVEGLLKEFTPADQALIVTLPLGGVVVPYTSDVSRIRRAITSVAGQGSRGETGSDMACRTRRFLESFDGFLATQADRPSPATVIVFTAGLAGPRRDAPTMRTPGVCELLVDNFRAVSAAAGPARVMFYVLHPADIAMTATAWTSSVAGTTTGSDSPLEGIESLAGVVGGTRLPLDAIGNSSLLRVARESQATYTAELEPEPGESLGRTRPVSIRITRRGASALVRPEITFAAKAGRSGSSRFLLTDLLGSHEAHTGVPLRVGGLTVAEPGGRLRVGIIVEPGDAAASIASMGAVLLDDAGRTVGQWVAKDTAARPIMGAIAAPPGTYRIRVAALDKDGRPGVAEADIDARLTTVGTLSLSSLLLGVSRATGFSPRLEFGSEPSALASFDLYGVTGTERVNATLEVAATLDGPALLRVPLALTRKSDTQASAIGPVPLGALPPGDYVVRGIIRFEDGTTGRVVRTLRKVRR